MPSYEINPDRAMMVIVDPQIAFGEAISVPNALPAVENMRRATNAWRQIGRVILTRHVIATPEAAGRLADFVPQATELLGPDSEVTGFYDDIKSDGDIVITKNRFNAFIGTDLEQLLQAANIELVIIAGLTTPVCVEGTVKGAHERDYRVILLKDACASQALDRSAEESHDAAIAEMGALWAETIETDNFLARLTTAN
jgi:nicotinamidase-related amidase